MCNTRPNIAFVVGQVSNQNIDFHIGYLKVIKKVIQYLKETIYLEIIYGVKNINFTLYKLIDSVNSNYARNPKDRKSVINYYFFTNRVIVSWYSKNGKLYQLL